MKKTTLFLACCIGLMFFASCKKDPIAPTITIMEGCVTENAEVYAGDEVLIGFKGTSENLTKFEIVVMQDGNILVSHSEEITIRKADPSPYSSSFTFIPENPGTLTVTGTATDANGLTASKSFNFVCIEKPFAKFLGHYEGDALFTGTMKVEMQGMDPMEQEVTDRAVPVILDLSAGETITEVIGTCKIEEQEMEIKGNVEGNTVTFEAVNSTISFDYDLGGFTVSPQMNMTYTVKTTLDVETLTLDGTCVGDGEIHLLLYNGTIGLDGTIGGSLEKRE